MLLTLVSRSIFLLLILSSHRYETDFCEDLRYTCMPLNDNNFSPTLPNQHTSPAADESSAHSPHLLPQVGAASAAGVPGTSPWAAFTSTAAAAHDLGDAKGGGIMRHQWDRESGVETPLEEGAPFVQDIFPSAARRAERERSRATLRREREASERLRRSVDFRQKEKQILDSVLGLGVYDRRIRPGGINSTGEKLELKGFLL